MLSKKYNKPLLALKYSGLIAFIIFTFSCLSVVGSNFLGFEYTISLHIGSRYESMIIFAIVNSIAVVLLSLNMFFYTKNRWDFGRIFIAYAAVTALCLLLVGLFPQSQFINPLVTVIHKIAAWSLIFMTPAFILFFLYKASNKMCLWLKITLLTFLAMSLIFLLFFVFFSPFFWQYILFLEAIYLAALVVITQALAFAPSATQPAKTPHPDYASEQE